MLSFERLTARNKNGLAYLVNVKPNEQEVDSPHKNTLKCILDCFERLAQYEEAAIDRQSVKSEDVAEAIEVLECIYPSQKEIMSGEYPHVADALDLAITALQAYQPWISVKDRLPTEKQAIAAWNRRRRWKKRSYAKIAEFTKMT